ncbi:MAG: glycosyltransferase [bacterium]|nr:glycosyltransferase [bacterium]
MKAFFGSTAPLVETGHGGGSVSFQEYSALQDVCTVDQILDPRTVKNLYPDNPFMFDYAASLQVGQADVAFVNGAPWNATIKASGAKRVIVDCPAHDLNESVKEFKRIYGNYPFEHMVDRDKFMLYTAFIQAADLTLVPSRYSEGALRANHPVTGRVAVIPHGVNLPDEIKPIPDMFTVGYLGANGPDKGVVYLVRAWAGLMYKDAELVLRTDGEFPLLARTKFRFMERVENTSDFYNSISVYVQPSVTEGFGLPVLEAMAHGRPVIVTEGAGVHELVQDGITGYVIPIRRPDMIAERLDYLKRNPDKIRQMGECAEIIAGDYTWGKVRGQISEAIRGVVN